MLRRLTITIMAAFVVLMAALPAFAAGAPAPHGRAALLMDAETGQILYQQNGMNQNFPASTTKLLTAIVAVEHGRLDQKIKVSAEAVKQAWDSSSCYLNQGEEQTLENLLYGLLLASGNDCAVAIAEGVGNGNAQQFVTWMNETAARLGATHTHFANPHGLHDPNHYTTALDLATIARAAFTNPTILKISGTKEFNWPGKSETNGIYYNHNKMLFQDDRAIAGKTGFTEEAGMTLVTAAKQGGRTVIGVVMGETAQEFEYGDMRDLIDYGFSQFESKPVVKAGTAIDTVPVLNGKAKTVSAVAKSDFLAAALKGAAPKLTVVPKLDAKATAPITAGQALGVLEIRDGDRLLATVPVVAQDTVAALPTTWRKIASGAVTGVKWMAVAFGRLLIFRTVVKTTRRAMRRSRRSTLTYRRVSGSARSRSLDLYRTKGR